MFKDDYKKANEELKIDPELYSKISSEIKAPAKEGPKIIKFPIKRVISIVASVAIVLSALIVYPYILPSKNNLKSSKTVNTSKAESTMSATSDINSSADSVTSGMDFEEVPNSAPEENADSKPDSTQSDTSLPLFSEEEEEKTDDWKVLVDPEYREIFKTFNINNEIYAEDDYYWEEGVWSDDEFIGEGQNIIAATKGEATIDVGSKEPDFSNTNKQVEEVDEADIVKTDGKHIYRIRAAKNSDNYYLKIYEVSGEKTKSTAKLKIKTPKMKGKPNALEMFLKKNKLFIIVEFRKNDTADDTTGILTYDISNRSNPKLIDYKYQLGLYSSSRLLDNAVYVVSFKEYYCSVDPENKEEYLPYCFDESGREFFDTKDIYFGKKPLAQYTVVCSYSTKNSELIDNIAILGGDEDIYMNTEYLLCTGSSNYDWYEDDYRDKTTLDLFKINNGKLKHTAHTKFTGYILNQFSLDIYKDHLRLVATVEDKNWNESNSLLIFDKNLKITGKIEGLAKKESIRSARFMGDIGYFVTFRQTDPLYCADLSNPKKPKILSALKIPGFSSYLHPYGKGLLLGFGYETDEWGEPDNLKLSMFDTSDYQDVKEITTELIPEITNIVQSYSEAAENHKAFFVNVEKNLIGFQYSAYVYCKTGNYYEAEVSRRYCLYKYTDQGFELVKEIKLKDSEFYARGLYIGDYFYISTDKRLFVYDMKTWEKVATIK